MVANRRWQGQAAVENGHIADSRAGGIGVHHDLVGFDPRGVGCSADLPCPGDNTEPDPSLPEKDQARETAERAAAANRKCVDAHPTFVRNLTTPTIARDVDRIREALGEDKIGYYGVSWGTALGAQYRTLFDAHVDKMLLDSVMPPDLNVTAMDDGRATAGENTFHDFASWIARYDAVYHFGTTEPDVAKALLDLWAELAGHPRGDVDGATVNGDARQPPPRLCGLGQAVGRPLQLVGHTDEPVTSIGWALAMQGRIGGALMTIEDDAHGSLSSLPCADAAVTFFDTGKTTSASCAGAPIPAP